MNKLRDQLKTISKSLTSLSNQIEKIIKEVDKIRPEKVASAPKKTTSKKKVAANKVPAKKVPAKQPTVIDTILNTIKRSKKGVTIAQLKEKTDFNSKQLSNVLYKLSKKGKIHAKSRGLYVKK